MWILRSQKSGDCYHLLVGQTYSVGRKDTDILIRDDPSISRKHALLTVTHLEENVSDILKLPTLKIQDAGSKYGTFRNGNTVQGEEIVGDGDNVKFGQFESVFSTSYVPLIITTSCVDTAVKKELKKKIHQLGGHLVSEWKPECTHLVMSDVKVTIKAVCCLISLKPLVTPAYLFDMVKNISSRLPEPISNKYLPPIGEAIIDNKKANFDVVPERKRIFENKTFIFLDKSQLSAIAEYRLMSATKNCRALPTLMLYKKMHFGVTLGCGTATYLPPDSTFDPQQILKTGTCVVQPQIQGTGVSVFQQKIFDVLQRNNKRMVQESDFGLAVAYCSTEVFCNPDSNIGSQSGFARLYSQSLTQQEARVESLMQQEVCVTPPRNSESSHKKSINSFPSQKLSSSDQSASVQDSPNHSISGKKRKIRDSSGHVDGIQQCSKQTKLENFVKITSSKLSNKEMGANSINIEGIALYSSSIKEEPQSADEMEIDNKNSVTIDSPATIEYSAPGVLVVNSTIKSSSKHSVKNIPKENKQHKPLQSSKISRYNENGFLNSRNSVSDAAASEHDNEENDLPKNLIQIKYAELVCRKPRTTNIFVNINTSNSVKNFKKFRKVLPHNTRLLPKIIGGHELEPYSKQASKALDDILNDSCDVHTGHKPDDEAGEFDWESQPRQRRL